MKSLKTRGPQHREKMKYLKTFGLILTAAMALAALVGVATASATTLEVGGVAQNKSVALLATLEANSSALLKDSAGTTFQTCTSSEIKLTTSGSFTSAAVNGPVATLTYGLCTHTTKALANGSLSFTWTSGTNASVSSSGAEVTVLSTTFGASAVCKTGAGTTIGTLTGVKEGNATLDVNAKTSCGILGTMTWTGSYTFTSPQGLGVVS